MGKIERKAYKENIKEFKNTKRGNKVYPLINRLAIDGILCYLCAIFLIVSTIIMKDSPFFYYMSASLIIAGTFFIIKSKEYKDIEIVKMKKAKQKKENDIIDKQ